MRLILEAPALAVALRAPVPPVARGDRRVRRRTAWLDPGDLVNARSPRCRQRWCWPSTSSGLPTTRLRFRAPRLGYGHARRLRRRV